MENQLSNSSSSVDTSQPQTEDLTSLPLLPRSAWNSHVKYLRVLFKAKLALDKWAE